MKHLRGMVLAVTAALLPLASSHATPLTSPGSYLLTIGPNTVQDTITHAGAFSDEFIVTIPPNTGLAGGVIVVNTGTTDITGLSLDLHHDGVVTAITPVSGPNVNNGVLFQIWSASYSGLSAGTYDLFVRGVAHAVGGVVSSFYNGTFTLAAVPLPASLTLFLSGLAALALAAVWRRRKLSV